MNVYIVQYPAHWLGGHAVVVAETEDEAVRLTIAAAKATGAAVKARNVKLKLLDTTTPSCTVTFSGDY